MFNWGSRAALHLTNPTLIKEFALHPQNYVKDDSTRGLFEDLTDGTMIFLEGNKWKRSRKVLSTAFHHEYLKNLIPTIISITQEKFKALIDSGNLKDVMIVELFGSIAGDVAGRAFFGKRFSDKFLEGKPMTTTAIDLGNDIFLMNFNLLNVFLGKKFIRAGILPQHRRLMNTIQGFRKACREMINEVRQSKVKEANILSVLLELESSSDEKAFTEEEIVGEFIGIFGAGTDTTSHLLNASLYFLWKHPEIYNKLKKEVDEVFSDLSRVDFNI